MKKTLSFVLAFMFIFSCVVSATDIATPQTYYYSNSNIEIQITHTGWTEDQLHTIATKLDPNCTSNVPAPCGLTCILLGHKIQSAIASTIIHKVYDIAPRCEQTFYEVNACERCDYSEVILISVDAIECCE